MLGKVQFQLQKLVDSYRSHIVQTISTPSESLLNELRTVEEMKRQCDEKRDVYEYMLAAQREKGRSRNAKGESFSSQQLQAAQEEYDEEATLFVFRLKSLKQGQSRSLLTQAARHHAAQLGFFIKGLRALEAVDPHVQLVTERQHIDYQFSGLEDDDGEEGDDDDGYDANDDGELSFDYGQNDRGQDVSTSRNSMELDQVDHAFAPASSMDSSMNVDKIQAEMPAFGRILGSGSQSAPLFPDKKLDPAEKIRDVRPLPTRKFHTYVLPTPIDAKNTILAGSNNPVTGTRHASASSSVNLWHSSPLEPKRLVKDSRDDQSADPIHTFKEQSVLKESNSASIRLPPPLAEGISLQHRDTFSDTKKIKRYAFSGPLTSKALSNKPGLSASGPISSVEHPQLLSSMLPRIPVCQPSASPKVSPPASPPRMLSPRISELHELPRPPLSLARPTRPYGLVGHSAPLVSRSQESSTTNKMPLTTSHAASPLPTPPGLVARSFSIPSSSQRAIALSVTKLESQNPDTGVGAASPPLTPISLTSIHPTSTASELDSHSGKARGMD